MIFLSRPRCRVCMCVDMCGCVCLCVISIGGANLCVFFFVGCAALQSLGAGERDDRDVIAAIEASKRENNVAVAGYGKEEEDPEILKAMAESR